jgi:hypothetical protein
MYIETTREIPEDFDWRDYADTDIEPDQQESIEKWDKFLCSLTQEQIESIWGEDALILPEFCHSEEGCWEDVGEEYERWVA